MVEMKRQIFDKFGNVVTEEEFMKQGGVLLDGQRMVVPAFLADHRRIQQSIDDTMAAPPYRGRPGFVQMPTGDAERRGKLQADEDKKLSERWRQPVSAAPAHDAPAKQPTPIKQDMAALYDKRDRALENRWRGAR